MNINNLVASSFCLVLFLGACQNEVKQENIVENLAKMEEVQDTIDLDYIRGKFVPEAHPDFVPVAVQHADREGMFLRKEAYSAFIEMFEAAQKAGIQLTIRSATRNFEAQKRIWEAKWTGARVLEGGENLGTSTKTPKEKAETILLFSSMPGTSRHHWGTDIDLNSFVNSYFEKGKGLKEYEWLKSNAASYGFGQPYTEKGAARPFGYQEEKWHWSYLPLSTKLTKQASLVLRDSDINGFEGAETATEIYVVERYVLGINPKCK